MRILIFFLSYFPMVGGAETAVKEITDRSPEVEFDMVTLRFDKSHPKYERIGNVNVYRIGGGLGYLSKIFFVPQAAFFAIRKNKENPYNVFWSLMTNMLFPVVLSRFLGNNIPYILTLQDGDPFTRVFNRRRIKIFHPLLKYGFAHAFKVQAISNFLAEWANNMGYKGKVEVIPNGVDTELFSRDIPSSEINDLKESLNITAEDKCIITTSRLVEKNGISDVVEALKFMPKNFKFLVLGTGPLEASLKQKVRDLNVEERVLFLGYIPHSHLPKYLQISDVFIRPSLSEGMGNSFIEAFAAGIPVIATPVGGIPDFLFDPDKDHDMPPTGLFVEIKSPRLIAFQVQRLLTDRVLRDKIVINAKRLATEKYDWDLISNDMKSRVLNV